MATVIEFLESLRNIPRNELISIKGIGDVLADSYFDFFNSERYEHLISSFQKLDSKGITLTINPSQVSPSDGPLSGQIICITGSFDIPRAEIKEKLESIGAKVTDTISTSTTILLCGKEAGSKLDKAKKIGTKIIYDYHEILNT